MLPNAATLALPCLVRRHVRGAVLDRAKKKNREGRGRKNSWIAYSARIRGKRSPIAGTIPALMAVGRLAPFLMATSLTNKKTVAEVNRNAEGESKSVGTFEWQCWVLVDYSPRCRISKSLVKPG